MEPEEGKRSQADPLGGHAPALAQVLRQRLGSMGHCNRDCDPLGLPFSFLYRRKKNKEIEK